MIYLQKKLLFAEGGDVNAKDVGMYLPAIEVIPRLGLLEVILTRRHTSSLHGSTVNEAS